MNMDRIIQWIFIFFIYCFLGWIWESSYRSMNNKKWINSGYLNGAWIPIYGFGALMVLIITFPFKEYYLIVYFLGALAATIFELIVGFTMEKIFHVRYWDYRHLPFNIAGYVCLPASILWGVFSLILVYIINAPIYRFVTNAPIEWLYVVDIILLGLFALDTILSTIQALNLKQMIKIHLDHLINEFKINEKKLKKAEKILKRNPNSLSHIHHLTSQEIKDIVQQLKDLNQ